MKMRLIRQSKGKQEWNQKNGFFKKWHAGSSKGVIFVRVHVHKNEFEQRHTMTIFENENEIYKAK